MKRFLTNWWFVASLIAVIAALVLCLGLPFFVGFLRPWWVRLLIFVIIAGVFGLFAWLRIAKARKASAAIETELSGASGGGEGQVAAGRMAEALKSLREASGGKRRDYLYSRPWYVIIGPPGAGKTTALVNSGLRFPFSNDSLQGVGGTRNLDFLFADQAVLIDTAGRYTSQDSDASSDAKGWDGFLGALKRNRPLQPINGVIVAIGVDELLRGDRASIDRHAATIRRRLFEVRRSLEIDVPVYAMLTKADLIAGFIEFYDDLDVEGRRAVLGYTLPLADAPVTLERLVGAFDNVAQAIEARQAKRLADEQDPTRRALILGFPLQIAQLRSRVLRLLDGVFAAGDQPVGKLRGFYLTSGVQEGAPLDRMLSGMAQVFDQPRQAAGGGLGGAAVGGGSGRAYFLNRLLDDVMFPEAGMVQLNPSARKRQRAQLTGALVGVAAVCVLTLLAWGVSFAQNRSFQSDLLARSTAAGKMLQETGIDLREVRDSDPSLEQTLDFLRTMRTLPQGYADQKAGGAPLTMRFGLYQSGLAASATEAYRDALRRVLLPRLLLQLEANLQADMADPVQVYEPLKIYLMLGGQGPMDTRAVKSWASSYWSAQGSDSTALRKELDQHLDALLEDRDLAVVWQGRQVPLDGQLVATARSAVQNLSIAERAYAILKQKAAASDGAPWAAASIIASSDARAFANGEAVLAAQVPYFYRREGYEKAYQLGLATVEADLKRDLWVFGSDADTVSMRQQIGDVRGGVAALYAQDYSDAWDKVVALLQPADYFHDGTALAAVTGTSSPLKLILGAVRTNTRFEGGSRAAGTMIGAKIATKLGGAAKLIPQDNSVDAGTAIQRHFEALHQYVGDGKVPGKLDEFLTALRNAAAAQQSTAIAGASIAGGAMVGQMAQATALLNQAALDAPPQLQAFTKATATGGGAATVTAASGEVSQAYATSVQPACVRASQDKYPFVAAAGPEAEMSVLDAQTVFGAGQTLDAFVLQRLGPLLNTTGPIWRWKDGDPITAALDPASPDSFAKAAAIRDLVSGGIVLKFELAGLKGNADGVAFQSGGDSFAFTAAAAEPKTIRWSLQGSAPEAKIVIKHGDQTIATIDGSGLWALFRLMDKARRENSGPTAFIATFGDSTGSAALRVTLPNEMNPFSRGGMWTFRCPLKL